MPFKHRDRKIVTALILGDLLSVSLSWFAGFFLRFHLLPGGQDGQFPVFVLLWVLLLTTVAAFYLRAHLYEVQSFTSWFRAVQRVLSAHFKSIAVLITLIYFIFPSQLSRISLGIYAVSGALTLPMVRILLYNTLIHRRKVGKSITRIVVIGNGPHVEELVENLLSREETGLRLIGWVDGNGAAEKRDIPDIGSDDLIEVLRMLDPDQILLGYRSNDNGRQLSTMDLLERNHFHVLLIPDFDFDLIGYKVEAVGGIPLIHVHSTVLSSYDRILKRVTDIGIAIVGLVVASPLFFVTAVMIRMTSHGPVFYSQTRITENGRSFRMHKFRTMRVTAQDEYDGWTTEKDPRVTWFGSFLRKTSIDELPQLWNVIKGDMSIVGPRPERPHLVDNFNISVPNYYLRHRMKGGITGWAQVNGWRGNTSLQRRIEYDIHYIKHWSWILDWRIILMTFYKGLVNENAY